MELTESEERVEERTDGLGKASTPTQLTPAIAWFYLVLRPHFTV